MVSVFPRLPYMLHCPKGHYCDITKIRPLLLREILAEQSRSPVAVIVDCPSINHLLDFNVTCSMFLWNNSIYNCRLGRVLGIFNKCSGLRPAVGLAAADFPRGVCLTISHNHKVFLFYGVWVRVGGFFKVMATFNHMGGSFDNFMAITGDV